MLPQTTEKPFAAIFFRKFQENGKNSRFRWFGVGGSLLL
jgi:hypothetical protein